MVSIRILVADDELLFRKCLVALIGAAPDMEVVGEAADGAQVLDQIRKLEPDLVLLDLTMPQLEDSDIIHVLKREFPQVRVLFVASIDHNEELLTALKSGARGYILKEAAPDELLSAIRHLCQGQTYLHPAIAFKALAWLDHRSEIAHPAAQLTRRQEEVLALLALGLSNIEIGEKLVITENTARKHVSSILGKLHLTHRVQAAIYAVQRGQVQSMAFR